jgi:hypothetical protein
VCQVTIVHRVDVVRESCVAGARLAVADHAHARSSWQEQREVN